MANYTKEEIAAFEAKDRRISWSGIVQALITSGVFSKEEIEDVNYLGGLADRYREYVWNRVSATGVGSQAKEEMVWETVAADLNIAIPTQQNIKILDSLMNEYKKVYGSDISMADLLTHIINAFGKYPTNKSSVKTVLESFNN